MANIFEHKDRRVIPNWRSFGRTTILGELNSFQIEPIYPKEVVTIDDYVIDWKLNKTVIHASDLLSAAIVNGVLNNIEVNKAALFIIKNINKSTKSQISLAHKILGKKTDSDISSKFNDIGISKLPTLINKQPFYDKIRETKDLLRSYSTNPILYVELSRYYSILGQEQNSITSMKIALHLAPGNRFILRSAARLFAHFHSNENNYLEYIHKILKNSTITLYDPWLTSTEISISSLRGINSRFIKKGIEIINSKNISPFNFTELASSIGTVELINGHHKKSRGFFDKALIKPNDNSLAQIEWASTKDKLINIDQANFHVRLNYEALAIDSFYKKEYDLSLDHTAKWFLDQPYSKRPILFGANVASTIQKNQKKSIEILKAGLISHPNDPLLINNIAYSLALENMAKESKDELEKVKHIKMDQSTKICLIATEGLAEFRLGNLEKGRFLYLNAIEESKKSENEYFQRIAMLNYAREEIRINSEYAEQIYNIISKFPDNLEHIEISTLRDEINDMYLKR